MIHGCESVGSRVVPEYGHLGFCNRGLFVKTVSVINYKGGVGKTTIVANVAAELGWRGKNILLIDLDPQASLTFSFMNVEDWQRDYANDMTIRNWYDAFIDQDQDLELPSLIVNPPKVNQIIKRSGHDGCIDLICSHLALINIDLELATMLGGGSLRQTRNNFLRLHSRLLDGLESVEDMEDIYDYVLIDCPPNFNIVTKTAIVASDRILIPAIPDFLSTLGINELQRHIDQLVNDFNGFAEQRDEPIYNRISPTIMGVIPTMVQIYGGKPISAQSQFINSLQQTGLPVFDAFIRRNNTIYGDAPQYGVPVVLGSISGRRRMQVDEELEDLTTEFLNRV
jgi:chromosome partitioning protein